MRSCGLTRRRTGQASGRRNYRARLVVERLTGKPLQSFQSAAMRQGTEREPRISPQTLRLIFWAIGLVVAAAALYRWLRSREG